MATKNKTLAAMEEPGVMEPVAAEEPAAVEPAAVEPAVPNPGLEQILMQQQKMIQELQLQLLDLKASKNEEKQQPQAQEDPEWLEIMETAKQAAEEGADPWEIEVYLMVPRKKPGEDQNHWMNINGRRLQVPTNGRRQKMKLPFALTLIDMLKAEEMATVFEENVPNYDFDNNPKT